MRSPNGWEPDWPRVGVRGRASWGTRDLCGAGLTGVGLRGGPWRTFAELRSLGTTLGTRRDASLGVWEAMI